MFNNLKSPRLGRIEYDQFARGVQLWSGENVHQGIPINLRHIVLLQCNIRIFVYDLKPIMSEVTISLFIYWTTEKYLETSLQKPFLLGRQMNSFYKGLLKK